MIMNREIKYTLLVDNQAKEGLVTEHGFAAWISAGDERILFDTGAGRALLPNAEQLDLDLSCIQSLVLSHGHYDHTGGVANFLMQNSQAQLYMGQAVALPRYSCHPDVAPRAIGIHQQDYRALLNLPAARAHELHAPQQLASGIGMTGPIPRHTAFEDTGGPFFLDTHKQQSDPIVDDQALWFETTHGLVIAMGCCHAGIVNTVEYIQKITGIHKIRGIAGGLHLLHANTERMEKTIAQLSQWELDFLIPCHCTGDIPITQLRDTLGSDVVWTARAGMTFALGTLQ